MGCLPQFERPPNIRRLARHRDFEAIIQTLEEDEDDDAMLYDEWLTSSGNSTALHIVMPYQPPMDLVNILCDRLSRSATKNNNNKNNSNTNNKNGKASIFVPEEALDKKRQTPLHLAAAHGCQVEIIERLLRGVSCAVPACTKDVFDRLPIHWACANPTGYCHFMPKPHYSKDPKFLLKERVDNMAKVVMALLVAYPEGICVADRQGQTPLTLAVKNKADERIIRILAAFDVFANKRKNNHNTSCLRTTGTNQTASDLTAEMEEIILNMVETCDEVSSMGFDESSVYIFNPSSMYNKSSSGASVATRRRSFSGGFPVTSSKNRLQKKPHKAKTDPNELYFL